MGSVKCTLLAGAATLISTAAASAADLPPVSPPVLQPPPIVEDVGSGWYLRGDIGFSNQAVKKLDNQAYTAPAAGILSLTQVDMGFDSAPVGDVGLGLRWNNWLRFDATAQYRAAARFHGSDNTTFISGNPFFPTGFGADNYSAAKSEWLFLANAYVDLGTWWCVTPFIGAGVGMAKVTIAGFRDDGVVNAGNGAIPGTAYFADNSTWNFAWAFHAGLAYHVTPAVTLELAYHYVNMGNGLTGVPRTFDGSPVGAVGPFTFNTLTSQDFTLGVRWMFDTAPPPALPLMRRG